MTDSVKEISDLLPDTSPNEIAISTGETVSIKMIGIGKMPKALKAAIPLVAAIKQFNAAKLDDNGEPKPIDFLGYADLIMHLIADHGEAVFDFSSVVLNKPREWFDDLSPDDFITIATAWVGTNYDFFIKKILPLLGLEPVENPTDGQTQSQPSFDLGTDSKISEATTSDSSASS